MTARKGSTANKARASVIAIGNFDGFHLGHKKIIERLKQIALGKKLFSIILTFTPNPRVYFNKELHLIHTDSQKKEILEHLGVGQVIFINFHEVVDMSDEQFLQEFLIEKFNMRHIVMGENFRFGRGREGDLGFLKRMAQQWGFTLTVVRPVTLNQQRISSSNIRKKLMAAEIPEANRMLGRHYVIEGRVVEGDKVGTELGFPTLNLETENTLLPEGVFKTVAEISGQSYAAVTYIGYRPTFSGKEKKIESHLFDFNQESYGQRVKIYFERKVRDDMKFDSKIGLIRQIQKDIENLKVDKGPFF